MQYNEIIYSIRERLSQLIDDSDISNEEIIFEINNQRALLYRNEYNQRNRVVDEDAKQVLCVDLQEVSDDECCVDSDCTVLRSVNKLPRTIELYHKNAIYGISSTTVGSKPFSMVAWAHFPYAGSNKYAKKEIYVAYYNGYIYLKSQNNLHKFLEKITIEVILEDPFDVQDYMDCDGGDCFDEDTFEYPLKRHMFVRIAPMVIQNLTQQLTMPEDNENDSEDEEIRTK